jgi:hypothetical protein
MFLYLMIREKGNLEKKRIWKINLNMREMIRKKIVCILSMKVLGIKWIIDNFMG